MTEEIGETDARPLKVLEKENALIKKMDAEAMLGIKVLGETIGKSGQRSASKRLGSTGRLGDGLPSTPGRAAHGD